MYRLNTALNNFTVGRAYQALSENHSSVALKNDAGDVEYVSRKFLVGA